jgi:peptide-methionine (S)-S-oxide reductase
MRRLEEGFGMAKATFAAGCFWQIEDALRRVPGVTEVTSGYTGGEKADPTYKQVCSGKTGHAEAVEVHFDPEQVSYNHLLSVFFELHDPTQLNRQGPDIGTQYRSAIFTHTPEQREAAESARAQANRSLRRDVVTEVTPASTFYPAEEYHQRYLEKKGVSVH